MKLVYFIITAACAVFYVMYKGDLSFVLFAFMLALPFVLYIALAIGSAFIKITVCCECTVTERGKNAAIRINIKNRSFIPVSTCAIRIFYTVSVPFESGTRIKYTAAVPLGGGCNETVTLNFLSEHCGSIEFFIKDALMYDLMGIFSLRRKISFRDRITVLPRVFPLSVPIENIYVYSAESNTFSNEKPGDDPSEIFMLREYRDGDRHNLIHWKLSGRSDNFIVKELSKPVSSKILIMTDLSGCRSADGADKVIEAAASVSGLLAEKRIAHSFAVPFSDYSLHTADIKDTDGFYSVLALLSQEIRSLEFEKSAAYIMELYDCAYIINGGFSRVIIVSERDGAAYADELADFCGDSRLTIICTSLSPSDENMETAAAEVVYADAEKLSSGNEIFLI